MKERSSVHDGIRRRPPARRSRSAARPRARPRPRGTSRRCPRIVLEADDRVVAAIGAGDHRPRRAEVDADSHFPRIRPGEGAAQHRVDVECTHGAPWRAPGLSASVDRMGQLLRFVIALGACGGLGCAAISGLDTLTVGDASVVGDAGKDARDDGETRFDGAPSCSVSKTVCAADKSGCCDQGQTCGDAGCCTADGGQCDFAGACCSGLACTTGGTCQSACLSVGAGGCQTGSSDTCCRGQAYCANGSCAACLANDAACTGDTQCCSHHCGSTSKVCSTGGGGGG